MKVAITTAGEHLRMAIGNMRLIEVVETPTEQNKTQMGEVARYDASKGFGFIQPEGGRETIFFHESDVRGVVDIGQKMAFDVGRYPKNDKQKATKCQRAEEFDTKAMNAEDKGNT